ncbi:aspartic peptidase domain-containing protein [Aspergillus coremiiformis]|uniref:Aspartic peptidase domain-containing protein n=1 Tax=Aspergillus coremiiformis TaxID=138285 RepID=A0A5N6Z8P0_9EURO|nr:aspartic peptidase domain-containing protein [Aspergillus coremiiformis]
MKLLHLAPILYSLPLSSARTLLLNRRPRSDIPNTHGTMLLATDGGKNFDIDVTVGADNQPFKLLVDTGSSDTYIMRDSFTCINATSNLVIPEENCNYGPETYTPSSSYEEIPGETFGVQYGAGRASGVMAYETITIANITVRAKLAIADTSEPMGDGVNNGLLGLGYPSLTSAHPGKTVPNDTYFFNRAVYSPVFNTMYEQGLVEPYFSIALAHTTRNRTSTFGGYLGLGELPPVERKGEFTTVPVEIMNNIPANFTSNKRQRAYWAFTVKGVEYGTAAEAENDTLTTDDNPWQVFVDTGNDFSILPAAVVDPVNARFSPPAVWKEDLNIYVVDCDAQAPVFGVKIGDQTFYHAPEDLIYDMGHGICASALVASEKVGMVGNVVLNVLGVPFHKNVVGVFDFGKNEMRYAQV